MTDGLIDFGEFVLLRVLLEITTERAGEVFDAADLNGDGKLTAPEFQALIQQVAAQSGFGSALRDVDERPWALGISKGRVKGSAEAALYSWGGEDSTGRAVISRAQWIRYVATVRRGLDILEFAAFDINGDHAWTATELATYWSALFPAAAQHATDVANAHPQFILDEAGFAGLRRLLSQPAALQDALKQTASGDFITLPQWCAAVHALSSNWSSAADGVIPRCTPKLAQIMFELLDVDRSGTLQSEELSLVTATVSSRGGNKPRGPSAVFQWFKSKFSGRA